MYQIIIEDSDEAFKCAADKNVLKAMEQLGARDIPTGCRGGGCGVCRVQVIGGGKYHTGKMSRDQVSIEDEKKGICLACKLIPDSDLQLRVLGKWQSNFCLK
jgi:ferredoxin